MTFDELVEYIEKKGGVLFGSRAWGGHSESSDWDYVMPLEEANKLKALLVTLDEWDLHDNVYYVSGYYVHTSSLTDNGSLVNITGCKKHEFEAWRTAIEMMKHAPGARLGKSNRQMLFEVILALLKKMI